MSFKQIFADSAITFDTFGGGSDFTLLNAIKIIIPDHYSKVMESIMFLECKEQTQYYCGQIYQDSMKENL